MTISVTVEELKKYESDCRDWWNRRTLYLEQTLITSMGGFERRINAEALKKWEAENPFPKLFPSV